MPTKWVKKIKPLKAVDVMAKLMAFLEEEWSLKRDKALLTCKECIDKYEGIVVIGNSFIDSRILPSLAEQKLKLIEEYARLVSLKYPTITQKFIPASKNMFSRSFEEFSYFSYDSMEAPIPQIYVLIKENNKRVGSAIFNSLTPEYMMMQALEFLCRSVPTVVPMTSIFADINVNRRSLRHVSYRFLKKFMNYNHEA